MRYANERRVGGTVLVLVAIVTASCRADKWCDVWLEGDEGDAGCPDEPDASAPDAQIDAVVEADAGELPTACGDPPVDCTGLPNVEQANVRCEAGHCILQCRFGYGHCTENPLDGCETDLVRDRLNCGICGNVCPIGIDQPGDCGWASAGSRPGCMGCDDRRSPRIHYNCDLDLSNRCEVNGWTDPNNCGGCGIVCPEGTACVRGACQVPDGG